MVGGVHKTDSPPEFPSHKQSGSGLPDAAILKRLPQGPMLRAVNAIADAVGEVHPDVAIDTLACTPQLARPEAFAPATADCALRPAADQWSRAPPRRTAPRPNVVVRLCTIECEVSGFC